MKSIFVSRIKYGKSCLETMISEGHTPEALFTLKENYKEVISDFGDFDEVCKRKNIPVHKIDDIRFCKQLFGKNYQPNLLRDNVELMKAYNPDVAWLFGFGEIIKPHILEIPSKGWIGIHPTLLPKYRGGAPLVYPLLKGHDKSGCTLMWLNEGLDTGDILAQKEFNIGINDCALDMYDKVIKGYQEMIKETLPKLESGIFPRRVQNEKEFIEQWKLRTPEDSEIDFNDPMDGRTIERYLHDQIRCVSGVYPSAFIKLGDGKKWVLKKSMYFPKTNKLNILECEII